MLDIKACLSARRWQVDSLATLCELMLFSQRATLLNRAYEPGVVDTCLYACSTSTLESEIMSSQLDMPLLLKERRGEEGKGEKRRGEEGEQALYGVCQAGGLWLYDGRMV